MKDRKNEETNHETTADSSTAPRYESEDAVTQPAEPTVEEQLSGRVAELEDKLLRLAAEFDNYRKRTTRQFDDVVRSANDRIILELLEIADNFERALGHAADGAEAGGFRQGVELIFNQLNNLLAKYGVTPIEAVGQPFDPGLHDAMLQIDSDEYEAGTVAMEMARGYRQGDRVIRHSKVAVSRGKNSDRMQENNDIEIEKE